MSPKFRTALLVATLLLSSSLPAFAGESVTRALKEGDAIVDLRYRYEFVDEAGFEKNANASTLRARVGYKTGQFYGLWALAEFAGNWAVPADQRYNSLANLDLNTHVLDVAFNFKPGKLHGYVHLVDIQDAPPDIVTSDTPLPLRDVDKFWLWLDLKF